MIGRRGFLLGLLCAPVAAKAAATERPFATGGAATAQPFTIGDAAPESLLPAARRLQVEEICRIFGVPAHLVAEGVPVHLVAEAAS